MKLPQIFFSGTGESTVAVSDVVFGGEVNLALLAQAVYVYQSNLRSAHAKALRRGEVDSTTKKVYKQKGTGRARHGARSAPLFVGGGQAHGPTGGQNYKKTMSQSMKLAALRSAFAAQVQEKHSFIANGAEKLKGQTKEVTAVFAPYTASVKSKVLVVMGENDTILRVTQNLPHIQVTRASRVNALEVVACDTLIVMSDALPVLELRLASKASKKTIEPTTETVAPVKKTVRAPRKTATVKKTA